MQNFPIFIFCVVRDISNVMNVKFWILAPEYILLFMLRNIDFLKKDAGEKIRMYICHKYIMYLGNIFR